MTNQTQNSKDRFDLNNDQLFAAFVDAMLDAKPYLEEASDVEWRQILRVSCRRQKRSAGGSTAVAI